MSTRIADIASDDLGDLIARYTAWREFTEDRHLEACAVYAQVKSEYDLEIDRFIAESRRSISATDKRDEAGIYRDLLAGKLDSFSNVLAMLSRELTRRGVMNG